jgi:hypothetical protein
MTGTLHKKTKYICDLSCKSSLDSVFSTDKTIWPQINRTVPTDVEDAICMLNGESLFLPCLKQLTKQPQEERKKLRILITDHYLKECMKLKLIFSNIMALQSLL